MARLLLLNGQAFRQRCHVGLLGLPDDVLAQLSRFLAQLCAQLTLHVPEGHSMVDMACAFSPCGRKLCIAGNFMGEDKIQHLDVRTGKLSVSSCGHALPIVNQVVYFSSLVVYFKSMWFHSYVEVCFVFS